jgi:AraC-like DNA-binding protein
MRAADAALERFLASEVEWSALPLPGSGTLAKRVRRVLSRALPELPTVATLAKRMCTSARSLQRQLAVEGTSVTAISTELRRSRAEAYLAMGLPIAEVSYLVGCAEPSVFHRAFKRWTGETAASYRARSREKRG